MYITISLFSLQTKLTDFLDGLKTGRKSGSRNDM